MLTIGTVILQERKRLGVTQEMLAEHCQVSKASVSKWEKGQSYPDITLLPKLAAYFGLSVDELLGYERELTKESIREAYFGFAARFAGESFQDVAADVYEQVKLYYHHPSYLLQMSVLMLNHQMLSDDPKEVLQKIAQWLERIRQLSDDVWVLRQATSLLAHITLMQKEPAKTLELLKGVIQPGIGDEVLLATAHEQLGDPVEARRVIQTLIYQSLISAVGSAPYYLHLTIEDTESFQETLRRTDGLIDLCNLQKLHPNICLQYYLGVAQCASMLQDRTLLYKYLNKFTNVSIHHFLPFRLRGDSYFNLLDGWLETLDLGPGALRSEEIVKQSIHDALDLPFFSAYQDDPEMKDMRQRLRFGLGGN